VCFIALDSTDGRAPSQHGFSLAPTVGGENLELAFPRYTAHKVRLFWPLLLLLTACGVAVPERAVLGTYDQRSAAGEIRLELLPDGSYRQTVQLSNGRTINHQGRWRYFPERQQVVLGTPYLLENNRLLQPRFRFIPVSRVLHLPDRLPAPLQLDTEPPFFKR
jgi:hypothetical protein